MYRFIYGLFVPFSCICLSLFYYHTVLTAEALGDTLTPGSRKAFSFVLVFQYRFWLWGLVLFYHVRIIPLEYLKVLD